MLGAGQSVETLTAAEGTAAINLTGNALGQSIYGNAGANVLVSGGGADYMVGGAGNDTFVLTNAPGVATVGDYAAGDVVDISQYLSVANGTNVVAGGYVKIVGTQLQIDANGGGDAFVTVGNVSGSGAVTIRYQSGGVGTDANVARSAGQEPGIVKLAAEGSADRGRRRAQRHQRHARQRLPRRHSRQRRDSWVRRRRPDGRRGRDRHDVWRARR